MVGKPPAETTGRQRPGVCTWCGHDPHPSDGCPASVVVAVGPSGGGKTPTAEVDCRCAR